MVKISTKVLYECEKCGWTYKSKFDAEECENFHGISKSREQKDSLRGAELTRFRKWQAYHEW